MYYNKWFFVRIGLLGLLLAAVCAALLPTPKVSAANTGDYPYATKPCVHAPYAVNGTGVQWCRGYDWGERRDDTSAANVISTYGYYYRNCTDYAAWRLAEAGVASAQYKGLGNAKEWALPPPAHSLQVDSIPAVGAVAVRTSGTYGHVAFIEAVQGDGTITVAQYNEHGDGAFSQQTGLPAALGFTRFVHFEAYIPKVMAVAAEPVPVTAPEAISAVEPLPVAETESARQVALGPEPNAVASEASPITSNDLPVAPLSIEDPPHPSSFLARPGIQSDKDALPQPDNVRPPDPPIVAAAIPPPSPEPAIVAEPPNIVLEPPSVANPLEDMSLAAALHTPASLVPSQWWKPARGSPPFMQAAAASPVSLWPLAGLLALCTFQVVLPVKMLTARQR